MKVDSTRSKILCVLVKEMRYFSPVDKLVGQWGLR